MDNLEELWTHCMLSQSAQPGRRERGTASARRMAAEGLDKDSCVKHHESFRGQYRTMTGQHPASLTVSFGAEFGEASAPLSSLKAITLPELILGKRHHGRVLYGRFCVTPFKVSSVNTVLEDSTGKGVRVAIYNVLSSTASPREIEARFPLGTRVAIKEPFFKFCADGRTAIRVDNPADIVVQNVDEDDISPTKFSDANLEEELETIRCKGNELFAEQNWIGAMNKYTQCINLAIPKVAIGARTNNTMPEKFNRVNLSGKFSRIVMLAYSNRAETRLRLQAYEDALSDADEALEFDPKHVKTLVRKGKAAHGLGLFERSSRAFKAALEQSPQQQSILENLAESTTAYEQSQTGNFDLSEYYSGDGKGDIPLCADFMGPVEIRRVRYGCGRRGLFATTGVAAGQLLLVSNAIAIARHKSKDSSRVSVDIQFKVRGTSVGTMNTEAVQNLIMELANRVMTSKRKIAQLYSLATDGKHEMEVPSMELFRPGSEWVPPDADKLEVDIVLIREIVKLNAFGSSNGIGFKLAKQRDDAVKDHEFTGLWGLPSFANHSCAPNCFIIVVGGAVFFRASRDIGDGEELTVPYIDNLNESREARKTITKNWYFTCECERCLLEDTMKPQLSMISESIPSLVDAANAEVHQDGLKRRARKELAKLADEVEKVVHSRDVKLASKQQDWIRAAFLAAFLSKYQLAMVEHDAQSRIAALRVVVDSMTSICMSERALQLAAMLLREVEQKYFKHSQVYRLTEERVLGIYRIAFGKLSNKILHGLIRSHRRHSLPMD